MKCQAAAAAGYAETCNVKVLIDPFVTSRLWRISQIDLQAVNNVVMDAAVETGCTDHIKSERQIQIPVVIISNWIGIDVGHSTRRGDLSSATSKSWQDFVSSVSSRPCLLITSETNWQCCSASVSDVNSAPPPKKNISRIQCGFKFEWFLTFGNSSKAVIGFNKYLPTAALPLLSIWIGFLNHYLAIAGSIIIIQVFLFTW